MKLSISANPTHEELKCFIALAATNTAFNVGSSDPKYANCGPQLQVSDDASIIFSANAVVRYIAATKEKLQYEDLAVDEWVEWESHVLSPWLAKSKKIKDKSQLAADLSALLEAKDSATRAPTTPIQYLFGTELTLADIVAGVTLRAALELVPASNKDNEILNTYRAYVAQIFKLEPFIKGEELMASNAKGAKPAKPKSNPKAKDSAPAKSQPKVVLSNAKPAPLFDTNVLNGHTSHNVLSLLESIFSHAIYASYPDVPLPPVEVTRTTVKNAHVGDYQCNSAMAIFGILKGTPHAAKSPRDVATTIIKNIPQNPMIERLSLAGAGFINCFLTPSFLTTRLLNILQKGVFPSPVKKQRIAVDFSSPNIAKDMHVGHLRSTIIGDTMCRILEFQGHDVLRLNHVGDWGTQFGMLICHLMEAYPTWESEMPDITDLTKLYKDAKLRFDQDEDFQKRSKHHVVLLQSGDAHCRKVWTTLCEISRREFQKVYTRLGVSLTEMGESFYNSIIPGVIEKVKAQGLTSDSDGAVVVFTEKFKHPFILVKGDGSYLYATTDIAALWYRLYELKADRVLYYTDYSQNDHFKLLFEVGEMAKIYDPKIHRVDHVGFGTVNDESGQRFKTRSGEVVRLVDLLDEAKTRMKEQLIARITSGQTSMSMDQVEYAAERIGYGAVKYFDLRQCPTSSYIFSFDRMLSTTGDTAVYLMFAYARLCSIIRKSGVDISSLIKEKSSTELIQPVQPTEQALALELLQLQDIILFVDKDLMSNRLCSYLYTLAERVQTFVTACRVIGSEEQTSRLLLCDATIKVMHKCFSLLGMEPLDQI